MSTVDIPVVAHKVGTVELTTRAGITYRQADHWTRRGYLTADAETTDGFRGSGHARTYDLSQVNLARTMGELVAAGLTVDAAHTAARSVIADGHADLSGFTLTRKDTP